jgi:hypothetical protein
VLKDRSARELAEALEVMDGHPHNTGGLSMLDEATLAFGWLHPEVRPAQEGFAAARLAHKDSYRRYGHFTDESWQAAINAAHRLAEALRALGDTRIPRCKEPAEWGDCNSILREDGTCTSTYHLKR